MTEEEIERISKRWKGCLAEEDIQTLVSELKKEKEWADKLQGELDHVEKRLVNERIYVNKLSLANQDLEVRIVDKVKELKSGNDELKNHFLAEIDRLTDMLAKRNGEKLQLEEENQTHITTIEIWRGQYHKTFKRVKELEATLASMKNDPSIGKLEIEDNFDDNN